jgi:hypothetical protein
MPVLETVAALATVAQLLVYLGRSIEAVHGIARQGRYANEHVADLFTELKHTQWFIGSCEKICACVLGPQLTDNSYLMDFQAMEHEALLLQQLLRKVQPDETVQKCKWIQKSSRCKELAENLAKGRNRLHQWLMILQM